MHWDLRHARIFIAVAEELHFSRAAERLGLAQSAVSRHIRWMEDILRVPLLVRTTRSVTLTPEGRLLLQECRRIAAEFNKSIKWAQSLAAGLVGEIEVGSNDFTYMGNLPGIVDEFRRRYPTITFRFKDFERNTVLEMLANGEIDIAFVMGPLQRRNLERHLTGSHRLMAVLPRNHRLARRKSLCLKDIEGEHFVFGSRQGWGTYRSFLDGVFQSAGFVPDVRQEVYESVAIFGLVAAGMGITIYPDCLSNMKPGNLALLPLRDVSQRIEIVGFWSEKALNQCTRLFIQFLKTRGMQPPRARGRRRPINLKNS